jgi:hypothetical protein
MKTGLGGKHLLSPDVIGGDLTAADEEEGFQARSRRETTPKTDSVIVPVAPPEETKSKWNHLKVINKLNEGLSRNRSGELNVSSLDGKPAAIAPEAKRNSVPISMTSMVTLIRNTHKAKREVAQVLNARTDAAQANIGFVRERNRGSSAGGQTSRSGVSDFGALSRSNSRQSVNSNIQALPSAANARGGGANISGVPSLDFRGLR